MDENAMRMQNSCDGILMPKFPVEKFMEAVRLAIKMNLEYVPPYESRASLYIRPLLIGTGPEIGVKPAHEFLFIVFVMPVGPYFPRDSNLPICLLCANMTAPHREDGKYKVGETMQPVWAPEKLRRRRFFGGTLSGQKKKIHRRMRAGKFLRN